MVLTYPAHARIQFQKIQQRLQTQPCTWQISLFRTQLTARLGHPRFRGKDELTSWTDSLNSLVGTQDSEPLSTASMRLQRYCLFHFQLVVRRQASLYRIYHIGEHSPGFGQLIAVSFETFLTHAGGIPDPCYDLVKTEITSNSYTSRSKKRGPGFSSTPLRSSKGIFIRETNSKMALGHSNRTKQGSSL